MLYKGLQMIVIINVKTSWKKITNSPKGMHLKYRKFKHNNYCVVELFLEG